MGLLIVDENKCKKDGICARDCPTAIIKLKEKESFPEIVPGGEDFCLTCGHCIAVCPHGALRHSLIPLEECPAIDKALIINDEQAAQFLRSRRSIRFFKDKPVEKEKKVPHFARKSWETTKKLIREELSNKKITEFVK